MQVKGQLQHPHVRFRASGRRAYMSLDPDELSPKVEKQTQTELGLVSAGKTLFVTPRLVLGNEESSDTPFVKAFADLRQLIRSPAWKSSLLVVFGHDPERHRDELERKIREDEASEAIDNEQRVFFDTVLAPLIQERETTLVNTIHECVQQEMQTQQLVIQNQQQRITQLTQQIEEWEKQVVHLKGKVDRRVAENNALRKEQYRQLLMLRDIMRTEPGAVSALNEAIATVLAGKQTSSSETTQSNNEQDHSKNSGRGWSANTNTQVLHREKEKWAQRAREAALECQQLRDKVATLTKDNLRYRASESMPWFLKPENAIAERQRIADTMRSYQGNWEEIGDSLVELLNHDILWAAVEQSARRGGKHRSAKGLEAMLTQLDNRTQTASSEQENTSEKDEDPAIHQLGRRRSSELGRLIPCRACNGVGYIHADRDDGANDADSYLRKTLEQVLELKTQLEKVNTHTLALEGQLQLSTMHAAELQEKIHQAELVKSSAVDSCLQTDLDEEEGIDVDEIMRSAYGQDNPVTDIYRIPSRQNRRNIQYDNLIVELKSTLAVKDEGLAENRKALEVAQERTVTLQRALQKGKDAHAQELAMLKTSLAFSLKTRNTKIEERQAAVKLLMKKFAIKSSPVKEINLLPPTEEITHEEDDREDDNDDLDTKAETSSSEQDVDQNEVKRMETLVERYAKDIIRVRKEHETQQELLKKAEGEIAEEDEKRSRTNSISQGSLVVSLASHPRDLFKALSTAQADILKQRRASQRSSALQTDRLLTLTTHLGHMSEELCTLRKRNLAEVEFWKLECEKLQNTNKALEAEQQIYQNQLQEARNQKESVDTSGVCSICEKHKKRLMQISNELLNQAQVSQTDPEVEVPAPSTLTESERKHVGNALLDLENILTGMTAAKQQLARELVATHLGKVLSSSPRRTTIANSRSGSKDAKPSNQTVGKEGSSPMLTRSTPNSPRKSFTSTKGSKPSRQLKTTGGGVDSKSKVSPNPTRVIQEPAAQANTEAVASNGSETALESASPMNHRKKLVHEVFEGGELLPTKRGLVLTPQVDTVLEENVESGTDNNADMSTDYPGSHTSNETSFTRMEHDCHDDSASDDAELLTLSAEEPSLMNGATDIERDPEVIQQLRVLISQSSAAKEHLAIRNWQVLVFQVICLSSEQRLDQLKRRADRRAKTQPDGTLRSTNYKINTMCDAMKRIVQLHRRDLDGAISAQDTSRKELKKTQAHLIHGVSMLLENLSRKGKPRVELNELLYPIQGGSPRRSPTSNRPLYPYAKVHMSHIPQTQQIPTSTFPALVSPSKDKERRNRSESTGGTSPQSSFPDEGYQLPHRLTKSAGPRPFNLVHSSICALRGSIPFPDPAHVRSTQESEGNAASLASFVQQRPVRPHSSPAGPRFMSPRAQDLMSSASSLHRPEKFAESQADI
ncbi:hypothetical protein PC123_g23721 [Phytophthora cactorum]|nr:hypothetical protein PC123_g23721 [Phytophthora cactorum]